MIRIGWESDMKKSKKDIAFDKERAKFRSEIRHLKSDIQSKDIQIRALNLHINELMSKNDNLKDWNSRLLEYMDMPEENMRRMLEEKNIESQACESIKNIMKIILGR